MEAWKRMPPWRDLDNSPCRLVVEESNSRSPPRAHHPTAKLCSGFQRRTSVLPAFMVQRDKSPDSSQDLFFSPWSQSPMTTVFFLHRDTMPGCQEMDFCEKQNFHRSWTCPQQMERVQVLMVSKVYITWTHFSTFERSNNENHIAHRKNKLLLNFQNKAEKESLYLKKIPGACKNKDELCKCNHLDFGGVIENRNHKCTPCVTIFFLNRSGSCATTLIQTLQISCKDIAMTKQERGKCSVFPGAAGVTGGYFLRTLRCLRPVLPITHPAFVPPGLPGERAPRVRRFVPFITMQTIFGCSQGRSGIPALFPGFLLAHEKRKNNEEPVRLRLAKPWADGDVRGRRAVSGCGRTGHALSRHGAAVAPQPPPHTSALPPP